MKLLRFFVPLSGAIVLLSALFSVLLFIGGVSDGFYYYNIHTKTRAIATTISDYKSKIGTYPDNSLIESWSKKLNLFPAPSISSPSENRLVDDAHNVNIPGDSYALAYWDGDDFEFYYPWKNSFTTSIVKHVTTALLISVILAVLAFIFHHIRFALKRQSEQDAAANP